MTDAREPADWRPIVAALANPDGRQMIGMLIVGQDPAEFLDSRSPSRRRHIVEALEAAGVVAVGEDGTVTLVTEVFGKALAGAGSTKATGIGRFVRNGRIAQMPASPTEREELLRWVAARVLQPGEVVTEAELNERLERFFDDTAALRRYLVDLGVFERRRDGSEYALVEG